MSDENYILKARLAAAGEGSSINVRISNADEIGNAQEVAALPTPGEEYRNVLFRLTTDNFIYYLNAAGDGWIALDIGTSGVTSVNGDSGPAVVLDAGDVGADPTGTGANAVAAHNLAFDHATIESNAQTGANHAGITSGNPHGTTSDDVPNDSAVVGATVTDALNTLATGSGGASWQGNIRAKCEALTGMTATDFCTSTDANALQLAIDALDDGDILEVQTNAIYDPILIPTNKEITVMAGAGFMPKITGQNGVTLVNGTRDVILAGLTIVNCTTGDNNGKGSAVCLAHQAIVTDVIFYDCQIKLCTGSGVMLSFHQSIGGDNYATANTLAEMSERVAFIGCTFSRAGTDKTEGGNLCTRGINQLMVEDCQVDAQSLTRGISLQNCINVWIRNNLVINCNDGNGGEAIKLDSLGTPVGYRISGAVIGNQIKTALEGIDIDDTTAMTAIYDNVISDCVDEGISLDGGSAPANGYAQIVGNVCFRCGNGIRLESGSVGELTRNVCFTNTTNNYLIENGYTLDATNTTTPADAPQAGDGFGPASATDVNFVAFDGTTGRLTKDSGKKASDFDNAVTVGASGCTFTTLNAAIDHCIARKGGTIVIRDQIHYYTAGTAKDVSNITFVGGGGDQSGGPGMIFWNSGAGAWTGNNVTFRNMVIRGRPGSSGSLLTPTGILGTGGAVLFLENCQFIIDGSTSPSLTTSLFNLNSLNARVYLQGTTCTRAAPGNRSIFSNDANAEFVMTGRSILTGATPKTVYHDAGSTVLFGTVTTTTLIDSDANITNTSTVAGTTVKDALSNIPVVATYTGNDVPGIGSNTLAAGYSRVWNQASSGKSFLVTNAAGTYRLVEMTDYA